MADENITSTAIRITPKTRRKMVEGDTTNKKEFLKKQEFISDELDGLLSTPTHTVEHESIARKIHTKSYKRDEQENQTVETTYFLNDNNSSVKSIASLHSSSWQHPASINKVVYDENRNIVSNINMNDNSVNKHDSSQKDECLVKTVYTFDCSTNTVSNHQNSILQQNMGKMKHENITPELYEEELSPDTKKTPHGYTAVIYPPRTRNKSDSDTANVDALYENGMFTKLIVTSDENLSSRAESPTKKRSNTYTPQKPKRNFDRDNGSRKPVAMTTSLDDLKELAAECVMTSLKYNPTNHVFSTKEEFESFIATEKTNYSSEVSDESSFLTNLDQSMNDLSVRDKRSLTGSSRYLSEKSKLLARAERDKQNPSRRSSSSDSKQRLESPLNSSNEMLVSRPGYSPTLDAVSVGSASLSVSSNRHTLVEEQQKIEQLENVLDSQIEQLESLLSNTVASNHNNKNNIHTDEVTLSSQTVSSKNNESILSNRLESLFEVDTSHTKTETTRLPCLISNDTDAIEMYIPNKMNRADVITKTSLPHGSQGRSNKSLLDPSKRTVLPDIPESEPPTHNSSFGFKQIRKSLRSAREKFSSLTLYKQRNPNKRSEKAFPSFKGHFFSKSFRLPGKRKSDDSQRNNEALNLVAVRYNTKSSKVPEKFRNDKRTSRMMAVDYDNIKKQLDKERQEIEEERTRLTELKRQAEEKAELQWKEKRNDSDRREIEERELESQKEKLEQLKREQELKAEAELKIIQEETAKMKKQEVQLKQREQELAELHIERERREELERLLKSGKENESILVRTLDEEKRKLSTLEKSLSEEKSRRLEIEKRLQDEEMKNKLNDDKRKAPDSRSNGAPSMNGTLKRRIPSYTFSLRSGQSSGNSDDINLLHHIAAAGHVIENCPAVKINRYSCRGFLQKMGKSRLSVSQWKRRWFVFDRKLRALCYYQDERKTKSKGILYFQSIQDVFVDASIKKSPNPKTTFCVRTPQRTFVLNAPSPTAMSIWIDVIFTGMEGNFMSMTL